MSNTNSKSLGLKLQKTKLKIRPFGSKSIKCVGQYMRSVMFGNNVANLRFFVVKKDVETPLRGRAVEELGIISLNGTDDFNTDPTEAICRISESVIQQPLVSFLNFQESLMVLDSSKTTKSNLTSIKTLRRSHNQHDKSLFICVKDSTAKF